MKYLALTILAMLPFCATAFCQITVDPVVPNVVVMPQPNADKVEVRIARDVRHELLELEHYSMWDDLGFTVRGTSVTLTGSVINSDLIKDAEAAAKRVEGVEKVTNKIEMRSPLQDDRRVRFDVAQKLFRGPLAHYGSINAPDIHIVVKGGYVRLVGYVTNQTDKSLATMYASQVANVFGVKNELQVLDGKTPKPAK